MLRKLKTLILDPFLVAFQFLTIIPLPAGLSSASMAEGREIGRSAVYFPAAGLIKGGILLLTYALTDAFFADQITAAIILVISIIITGGFHLDGLADTFDAIASGKPVERKLEIMKESTTGPAGITAIVLVILLKYTLILSIISAKAIFILLIFPVLGSWSIIPAMFHGKSARSDGLGRIFIEKTGLSELLLSGLIAGTIIYLSFALHSLPVWPPYPHLTETVQYRASTSLQWAGAAVLLLTLLHISTLLLAKLFNRQFGGLTGDCLGAVSELNEVLLLLLLAALYGNLL